MSLPQTDAVGGNCSAGNVVRVTFAHSRRNSRSLDQQLSTDFANFYQLRSASTTRCPTNRSNLL